MTYIGKNIKILRGNLNWTAADMGKRLNISTAIFVSMESGETQFNMPILSDIAKVLKVHIDILFERPERMINDPDKLAIQFLKDRLSVSEANVYSLQEKLISLHEVIKSQEI